MARTRTTGKLPTKAPSAKQSKKAARPAAEVAFADRWNALDRTERRQIRRLVRIGRPQDSVEHAELANGFAAYQRTRPWFRFYFIWIVPVALAAFIAAANIHPIVLGLVLGAVVVSYMSRRNFRRAEAVNAPVFSGESGAVPAAA